MACSGFVNLLACPETILMIKADIHTHSSYSTDSTAPLREMVEGAVTAGLDILCVTEHMDAFHHIYESRTAPGFEYPGISREELAGMFVCDTPSFIQEMLALRDEYSPRLRLLIGMELGLQPGLGEHYAGYVASWPFDMLIGSCHEADKIDPYYSLFFSRFDHAGEAIALYLSQMLESITNCSGSFDTLGHMDYALRYHRPPGYVFRYEDHSDILEEILSLIIKNDKAIELNTGSFKYFEGEHFPMESILRRYREKGGRLVTIGSDAHAPGDLARSFDTASRLLTDWGFSEYTVFEKRVPRLLPL